MKDAIPHASSFTRVGIVANLRPIKNIELFVRAAGKLAAEHPGTRFRDCRRGRVARIAPGPH